jgi:hypothetical protein
LVFLDLAAMREPVAVGDLTDDQAAAAKVTKFHGRDSTSGASSRGKPGLGGAVPLLLERVDQDGRRPKARPFVRGGGRRKRRICMLRINA